MPDGVNLWVVMPDGVNLKSSASRFTRLYPAELRAFSTRHEEGGGITTLFTAFCSISPHAPGCDFCTHEVDLAAAAVILAVRLMGREMSPKNQHLQSRTTQDQSQRAELPPSTPSPPPRGDTAEREANQRAQGHARITLIRHGEPDWSPIGGPSVSDPTLTPFGVCQAKASARVLADQEFDALYVSPYLRARETAAVIGEALGVEPVVVEGIEEVGVNVEGLTQEEVNEYFLAGSQRPLSEHWSGWPGSETFHDFHQRVTSSVTQILERHACHPRREHDFTLWNLPESKPSIAIVAHGGTNAVILTHLLDIRPVPWEWMRFETGLAAFSILQSRPIGPEGHAWSLQNFNCEAHLFEAGLR
jgi:probable phosphoglycerate mutase